VRCGCARRSCGSRAITAPLKPHFAYGQLGKPDFALAHAFHIANHQDEISVG
jgi:hypothetical protein